MSSLRNAVKRITHKERSQPQSRAHLGILEKKSDYKERALDYHRKEDRVNAAKKRASMRNPDEFYFGMRSAKVSDGRHRKTDEARQKEFERTVGTDTVRIMKDQDLSYIRLQKQRDAKKVARLKSSLHFLANDSDHRKHTIFVDSRAEADNFDAANHFNTLPALVERAFNRPRVENLKRESQVRIGEGTQAQSTCKELKTAARQSKKEIKKASKARARAYAEIAARSKRVSAMERAEAHLVTEKLVASKGRKRKIKAAENGQPAVYKWRRRRVR